jgi:ankyrin repeat protein
MYMDDNVKNNNNNNNNNNNSIYRISGVTPLHRACYSGATSTVRLLLQHIITTIAKNNHNMHMDHHVNNAKESMLSSILLLPDTSFNDYQTPLHKCASGGRYLVVQLLLDFIAQHDHDDDSHQRNTTMLLLLLSAKDALGRTPLDVATELKQQQQHLSMNHERPSVQRWDTIAGGHADWDICVQVKAI